ncbi:hypothetical protein A3F06_00550 [candidate division TM6 bacterium RIFCSPHIGHO2_12_FULL_36_22]|nr:MAG: hypothetical protein A3F06_00550 [candidate division TM6 bacterium RIFCSPHIGHO2_12_FULL_36_22]
MKKFILLNLIIVSITGSIQAGNANTAAFGFPCSEDGSCPIIKEVQFICCGRTKEGGGLCIDPRKTTCQP